jgi:methanogenic corrinoid protein MtbC1
VEEAVAHHAQIIACSALLTTTMKEMEQVVKAVRDANLNGTVKVMIGGAPVTESFKNTIGADRYTSDAATAAEVALELCSGL